MLELSCDTRPESAAVSRPAIVIPVRVRGTAFRLSARFREGGDELVLFLHGLGSSKACWRDAWQRPELRGRSLLAPDLPGFGHTSPPPGFSGDLASHAGVLAALIDAHALRRIHLVAHSMGGSVALLLPPQVLARLASLVLVEPRLLRSSCGIAAEAADVTEKRFREKVFPRMRVRLMGDPRPVFDFGRADPAMVFAGSRSMLDWTDGDSLLERFRTAPCRRFFVYGADNRHLDELARIAPELTVPIAGAAHFVMNDNPDGFFGRLPGLLGRPS